MSDLAVVILIFCLLNAAIDYGEASPEIQAAASSPWYCNRLVPAFITSAVTPCTYPCLFLSAHEHPHIVVHPEPDGTPCRITAGLFNHFKVGKCEGSVCRPTSSHAPLKRRKRFLCLYSLVKLIKAKKKLAELKAMIRKLELEAEGRRSGAIDSVGARGADMNGIGGNGIADGGGLNIGNRGNTFGGVVLGETSRRESPSPVGSTGITGRNAVIENPSVGGSPNSGLLGSGILRVGELGGFGVHGGNSRGITANNFGNNNFGSLGITETTGSTVGAGTAAVGGFPGIDSTVVGSNSGRGTARSPGEHTFGSTGGYGRGGINAGSETTRNSASVSGTSSTSAGNIIGSSIGRSGISSSNGRTVGLAFSGGSIVENRAPGDSGSATGGLGISASEAASVSGQPGVVSSAVGSVTTGRLVTIGTTGGTITASGSANSPGAYASGFGFGESNISDIDVTARTPSAPATSNRVGTSVGTVGASSAATISVPSSSAEGTGNSAAIGSSNSNDPSSGPWSTSAGIATPGRDGYPGSGDTAVPN